MKLNLRQSDVSASRKGCTYYGLGAGSSLPHWLVVRQVIGLSGKIIPAGIRDFWCMEFLVPGRLYYFTIKSREINPLSPNSDQHQICPGKINVYSIPEVMRIKDTTTQDEFS